MTDCGVDQLSILGNGNSSFGQCLVKVAKVDATSDLPMDLLLDL